MQFDSKLPGLPTSIFSVMTALAKQHGALNLAQGFPDYPCDPKLVELAVKNLRADRNQYAPMPGVAELNAAIARKISKSYGYDYDPQSEITITAGATQALFGVFAAFVRPGDSVLIVEPAYDSYRPVVELFGGKPLSYRLAAPTWEINWSELRSKLQADTRMLVFNTPQNPTGKCWSEADFKALEALAEDFPNLLILSDEVYEHLTFDGFKHRSLIESPKLRNRAFCTYSFGKTLHATGWKLGYLVADAALTAEVRKVHQFNIFSTNTPFQYAIAEYLEDEQVYLGLPAFFEAKRNRLLAGLADTKFEVLPCKGTYFLNLGYSALSAEGDRVFAERLVREAGLATIPLSAFYHDAYDQGVLRLCFAKTEETLDRAIDLLQAISAKYTAL